LKILPNDLEQRLVIVMLHRSMPIKMVA